jgi:hypothetical protein
MSPFDLLPDEVVVSVLAFVGARDEDLPVGPRGVYINHLFQAQLVCKRFAKLAHQVKSLDWPLDSSKSALGLMAFVHHPHFSVDRMNLYLTESGLEDLPHEFIFAGPLLKLLPESINLFCITSDVKPAVTDRGFYVNMSEPEANLVERLLLSPKLRKLSICCPIPSSSVSIEKLRGAPGCPLQNLDLSGMTISIAAVTNLLHRCAQLETLKANVEGKDYQGMAEDMPLTMLVIKSEVLKVLWLSNDAFLSVNIQAPNLVELDCSTDALQIAAPALEQLTVRVDFLVRPVVFNQPCSRLVQLCALDCRGQNVWADYTASLLRQCASIKSLLMTQTEETDSPSKLSVGQLMSALPAGLTTLRLDSGVLYSLGLSQLWEGHTYPGRLHVEVGLSTWQLPYLQLRALCKAVPNLQKLHVILRGEMDCPGIALLLRSDFRDVPQLEIDFLGAV